MNTKRPLTRSEARLHEIVSYIRVVDAQITWEVGTAFVMGAAPSTTSQMHLLQALRANPDLFWSGRSSAPMPAQRLIIRCQEAGYKGFVRPRCATCRKQRLLASVDGEGGRLCSTCASYRSAPTCNECGQRCASYRRLPEGYLCTACARKRTELKHACGRCSQVAYLVGQRDGQRVCSRCYESPRRRCGRCGQSAQTVVKTDDGGVCQRCYDEMRRYPKTCPQCSAIRLLAYRRDGADLCADCAGVALGFACDNCGTDTAVMQGRLCTNCKRDQMLEDFLHSRTGNQAPSFERLRSVLADQPAASTIKWLRIGHSARIIRQMIDGEIETSLDEIAALPQSLATGHAAALLMESGIVEHEQFDLVKMKHWERELISTLLTNHDQRVVRRYCEWVAHPRILEAARKGRDTNIATGRWKTNLRAVAALVISARASEHDLSNYPQRALDDHLAAHPYRRAALAQFLRWAEKQGLTSLRATYSQPGLPASGVSEQQRTQWLKRVVTDDEIMDHIRLAGFLLLTYGLPATRIASISCSQVDVSNGVASIRFARSPVTLPHYVTELVVRQLEQCERSRNLEQWLFPGRLPGQHLKAVSILQSLKAMGIKPVQARTYAQLALAREVPSIVLVDLLGISKLAAYRLVQASARQWSEYPRIRISQD